MTKKKTTLASVRQRLSALPKLLEDTIGVNGAKYHAVACREVIQEGLRKANLVDKLLDVTLVIKRKVGSSRVNSPLMMKGDSDKLSMIYGLKVKKAEKRYKLIPWGKHRSGQSQMLIWTIHEKGAIVPVTDKMRAFWAVVFGIFLSKAKKFILIKPRFPLKKGYQRYLSSIQKKEVNLTIQKAMKSAYLGSKKQIKADFNEWENRAKEAMAI